MWATLGSPADNAIGWGGCGWLRCCAGAVWCCVVAVPGGLNGRGGLACSSVVCAGPIRAGGAESADIPHSDREPAEDFHRLLSATVESLANATRTFNSQRSLRL